MKKMKKRLSKYQKILLLLVVPILFIAAYMLGSQEAEPEPLEDEVIKDYTAAEPSEVPAAPMPKKEEITVPGQHDRAEAQEIAAAFVMAFHAIDAENPYQYLEDAKPYMTEKAFNKIDGIPKRGTLDVQKSVPTGTDLLPIDLTESKQLWRVGVTSLENEEYIFTEYQVTLVKEDQGWKVSGVTIND